MIFPPRCVYLFPLSRSKMRHVIIKCFGKKLQHCLVDHKCISSILLIKFAVKRWTLHKMEDLKKEALHWEVAADAECISQTFNQIILTSG